MNEIDTLSKLSELHKAGELTDEEFAREKAKVIAAPEAQHRATETPEQHAQRIRAEKALGRKRALIFVGIFGGLLLLMFMFRVWTGNSGPSEEDYKIDAYIGAQSIVENHLKSPSTADFPSIDEAKIVKNGYHSYTITSYVDATNSFGAKIRTHYTLKLHEQGDEWVSDGPPIFDGE